jgi:DNA-directed RNA polymerase subunit RPC12/RpoP
MAVSNRTWACVKCGKTYRRPLETMQVRCAGCGDACERIPTKIRVPSPANRSKWNQFWREYHHEVDLFRRWQNRQLEEDVTLPILRIFLHANRK